MKRRISLSLQTHLILGRTLSAIDHLLLAVLRETRDQRQRGSLLQFRADMHLLRCSLDGTVFRDYGPLASDSSFDLERVYYSTNAPLSPEVIVELVRGTSCARVGFGHLPDHGSLPLNQTVTETLNAVSRDLLAMARLATAMTAEHAPRRRTRGRSRG